ncbi:hypothetical protein RO3G_14505 [Lichtheimia corymbifera JMRC:FSU:9682]|uniref:Uncharacterized protein n=1 Tax=Lichtheimia corymbifera JMRC:FSU:9682 TaxID=1263082 RepID=A0A068RRA7_9FUNG|nr:hypothetical protein RO3G_14505 [Lichtheimia corymbifera JMRC:FSU:9682]
MNFPETQIALGGSKSSHRAPKTNVTRQANSDSDGIRRLHGKAHSTHHNTESVEYTMHEDNRIAISQREHYIKPSYSMPLRSSSSSYNRPLSLPPTVLDDQEHENLMRDVEQAKQELHRFRSEMEGLAKQIDGMALDLKDSKDRVSNYTQKLVEIEHDLTTTQEVNVDLQVLLENAVRTQKESDGKTTHVIRHMHSNLANIVYENSQLQERLESIEQHQQKHHGTASNVGEKMREYANMLEQAQDTLHVLRTHRPSSRPVVRSRDDIIRALSIQDGYGSRRASEVSSVYMTDDEEVLSIASRKQSESTAITAPSPTPSEQQARSRSISPDILELYRHRIIRKRPSLPDGLSSPPPSTAIHFPTSSSQQQQQQPSSSSPYQPPPEHRTRSPQQGLQMLFKNQGGHGLGLSSLTKDLNVERSRSYIKK